MPRICCEKQLPSSPLCRLQLQSTHYAWTVSDVHQTVHCPRIKQSTIAASRLCCASFAGRGAYRVSYLRHLSPFLKIFCQLQHLLPQTGVVQACKDLRSKHKVDKKHCCGACQVMVFWRQTLLGCISSGFWEASSALIQSHSQRTCEARRASPTASHASCDASATLSSGWLTVMRNLSDSKRWLYARRPGDCSRLVASRSCCLS